MYAVALIIAILRDDHLLGTEVDLELGFKNDGESGNGDAGVVCTAWPEIDIGTFIIMFREWKVMLPNTQSINGL